jgi:hypothetical protein
LKQVRPAIHRMDGLPLRRRSRILFRESQIRGLQLRMQRPRDFER